MATTIFTICLASSWCSASAAFTGQPLEAIHEISKHHGNGKILKNSAMMQKTNSGWEAQATFCSRIELLASSQSMREAALSGHPVFQRIKDRGWALGRHANASQPDHAQSWHATVATLPSFSLAAFGRGWRRGRFAGGF
jgi:hypothetical protein